MSSVGKRTLRARLLGASSYACLMLLLSRPLPAIAADLKVPVPVKAPTFQDRWFLSVEGGYLFNHNSSNLTFDQGDDLVNQLSPLGPGRNGGTVGVRVGRTFGPSWDVALGYNAALFRTARSIVATSLPNTNGGSFNNLNASASSKFWYQTGDLEIGYRPVAWNAYSIRTFVGARVISAHNRISYDYNNVSDAFIGGTFTKLGSFDHDIDLLGIGPRAGIEASVPLQMAAPLTLDVAGAAAVMFSRSTHDYNFSFSQDFFFGTNSGAGSTSTKTAHTVTNLEARAGLSYRVNSSKLTVGYQVQQWYNLIPTINSADSFGNFQENRANLLVHGPFAKITVELP